MAKLDPSLVTDYQKARGKEESDPLCFAPFSNIYFNVAAEGAACWLTFNGSPKYPEYSLREIWFGKYFNELRQSIKDCDLTERCRVCESNIKNRLFEAPLARAYDTGHPVHKYPTVMEFELSNFCNLGCIMCNGRLSSTIRKNRDKLPPLESPYDDKFVSQLEEFLPHLKEARFNGGEPFLQKICWSIWEKIIAENKSIEICVATNGTVWNDKVADILNRGNFRINLSLDGMTKETYESIRIGSNFEKVIANIHRFGAYCRERNSTFSIMINPMRVNWQELPLFVEFCNEHEYHLYFNTIYRPFHLALWTLPSEELEQIQAKLTKHQFGRSYFGNVQKYRNLVERRFGTWVREQKEREKSGTDFESEKLRRQSARDTILQALKGHIQDQERLSILLSKLDALETKVRANLSVEDVYALFLESPIDWLRYDLENRSEDEMVERLYKRLKYY